MVTPINSTSTNTTLTTENTNSVLAMLQAVPPSTGAARTAHNAAVQSLTIDQLAGISDIDLPTVRAENLSLMSRRQRFVLIMGKQTQWNCSFDRMAMFTHEQVLACKPRDSNGALAPSKRTLMPVVDADNDMRYGAVEVAAKMMASGEEVGVQLYSVTKTNGRGTEVVNFATPKRYRLNTGNNRAFYAEDIPYSVKAVRHGLPRDGGIPLRYWDVKKSWEQWIMSAITEVKGQTRKRAAKISSISCGGILLDPIPDIWKSAIVGGDLLEIGGQLITTNTVVHVGDGGDGRVLVVGPNGMRYNHGPRTINTRTDEKKWHEDQKVRPGGPQIRYYDFDLIKRASSGLSDIASVYEEGIKAKLAELNAVRHAAPYELIPGTAFFDYVEQSLSFSVRPAGSQNAPHVITIPNAALPWPSVDASDIEIPIENTVNKEEWVEADPVDPNGEAGNVDIDYPDDFESSTFGANDSFDDDVALTSGDVALARQIVASDEFLPEPATTSETAQQPPIRWPNPSEPFNAARYKLSNTTFAIEFEQTLRNYVAGLTPQTSAAHNAEVADIRNYLSAVDHNKQSDGHADPALAEALKTSYEKMMRRAGNASSIVRQMLDKVIVSQTLRLNGKGESPDALSDLSTLATRMLSNFNAANGSELSDAVKARIILSRAGDTVAYAELTRRLNAMDTVLDALEVIKRNPDSLPTWTHSTSPNDLDSLRVRMETACDKAWSQLGTASLADLSRKALRNISATAATKPIHTDLDDQKALDIYEAFLRLTGDPQIDIFKTQTSRQKLDFIANAKSRAAASRTNEPSTVFTTIFSVISEFAVPTTGHSAENIANTVIGILGAHVVGAGLLAQPFQIGDDSFNEIAERAATVVRNAPSGQISDSALLSRVESLNSGNRAGWAAAVRGASDSDKVLVLRRASAILAPEDYRALVRQSLSPELAGSAQAELNISLKAAAIRLNITGKTLNGVTVGLPMKTLYSPTSSIPAVAVQGKPGSIAQAMSEMPEVGNITGVIAHIRHMMGTDANHVEHGSLSFDQASGKLSYRVELPDGKIEARSLDVPQETRRQFTNALSGLVSHAAQHHAMAGAALLSIFSIISAVQSGTPLRGQDIFNQTLDSTGQGFDIAEVLFGAFRPTLVAQIRAQPAITAVADTLKAGGRLLAGLGTITAVMGIGFDAADLADAVASGDSDQIARSGAQLGVDIALTGLSIVAIFVPELALPVGILGLLFAIGFGLWDAINEEKRINNLYDHQQKELKDIPDAASYYDLTVNPAKDRATATKVEALDLFAAKVKDDGANEVTHYLVPRFTQDTQLLASEHPYPTTKGPDGWSNDDWIDLGTEPPTGRRTYGSSVDFTGGANSAEAGYLAVEVAPGGQSFYSHVGPNPNSFGAPRGPVGSAVVTIGLNASNMSSYRRSGHETGFNQTTLTAPLTTITMGQGQWVEYRFERQQAKFFFIPFGRARDIAVSAQAAPGSTVSSYRGGDTPIIFRAATRPPAGVAYESLPPAEVSRTQDQTYYIHGGSSSNAYLLGQQKTFITLGTGSNTFSIPEHPGPIEISYPQPAPTKDLIGTISVETSDDAYTLPEQPAQRGDLLLETPGASGGVYKLEVTSGKLRDGNGVPVTVGGSGAVEINLNREAPSTCQAKINTLGSRYTQLGNSGLVVRGDGLLFQVSDDGTLLPAHNSGGQQVQFAQISNFKVTRNAPNAAPRIALNSKNPSAYSGTYILDSAGHLLDGNQIPVKCLGIAVNFSATANSSEQTAIGSLTQPADPSSSLMQIGNSNVLINCQTGALFQAAQNKTLTPILNSGDSQVTLRLFSALSAIRRMEIHGLTSGAGGGAYEFDQSTGRLLDSNGRAVTCNQSEVDFNVEASLAEQLGINKLGNGYVQFGKSHAVVNTSDGSVYTVDASGALSPVLNSNGPIAFHISTSSCEPVGRRDGMDLVISWKKRQLPLQHTYPGAGGGNYTYDSNTGYLKDGRGNPVKANTVAVNFKVNATDLQRQKISELGAGYTRMGDSNVVADENGALYAVSDSGSRTGVLNSNGEQVTLKLDFDHLTIKDYYRHGQKSISLAMGGSIYTLDTNSSPQPTSSAQLMTVNISGYPASESDALKAYLKERGYLQPTQNHFYVRNSATGHTFLVTGTSAAPVLEIESSQYTSGTWEADFGSTPPMTLHSGSNQVDVSKGWRALGGDLSGIVMRNFDGDTSVELNVQTSGELNFAFTCNSDGYDITWPQIETPALAVIQTALSEAFSSIDNTSSSYTDSTKEANPDQIQTRVEYFFTSVKPKLAASLPAGLVDQIIRLLRRENIAACIQHDPSTKQVRRPGGNAFSYTTAYEHTLTFTLQGLLTSFSQKMATWRNAFVNTPARVNIQGNGGSVYVRVGSQRWRLNKDGTRTLQPNDGRTVLPASTLPGTQVECGPGISYIDASDVPASTDDDQPSVVLRGPSLQSGQATMKGNKAGGTLYYIDETNLNGAVTIDDTEHAALPYSSVSMPQSWTADNSELTVNADHSVSIRLKARTVRGSHPEDGADTIVVKDAVDAQAIPHRAGRGSARLLFWFNRGGRSTPYELVFDQSGKASFKEKVVDYSEALESLLED